MGRKPLIRSPLLPYHVTVRSNNREWFYLALPQVWEIFQKYLNKVCDLYKVRLHASVLMSNHLHLLITTPLMNLDEVMRYFLRESSRSVNSRARRINHVFGGPYKWSLIGNAHYYSHALKYVYRNPVKAKIVRKVESYSYSTLIEFNHHLNLSASVFDSKLDVHFGAEWLEWLNSSYSKEEDDCIRRALRRKEFQFTAQRKKRHLPPLFRTLANAAK